MRPVLSLLLLLASSVLADEVIECDADNSCPEDKPCCSQYGVCGTGVSCLGGCDPRHSFNASACLPMPVCRDLDLKASTDAFEVDTNFLGDANETDWVYNGYLIDYDDSVLLAMPKESYGTVVSSTFYVWYGKITATLKTSRGAGVVTSFILFSNVHDEIDWEFVGYNLSQVETNYYYQGVLNYTNGRNVSLEEDVNSFEYFHDYEIDWKEDVITWSIDGDVVRTLKKEDTYNETTDKYMFPQTPSRVQLSIWPAGAESNAIGTVSWAGGNVDWDSDDIQDPGYYYYTLKELTVECYDVPDGTEKDGDLAYYFKESDAFDQGDIMITNNSTKIKSLDDTGFDPDLDDDDDESSSSSSSSSRSSSSSSRTGSSSTSSATSTSTSNSDDDDNDGTSSGTTSSASSAATGFVQNMSQTASSSSATSNNAAASLSAGFLTTISFFASVLGFL
ncbi:BA75_01243T0 [Komagataella pastoris]|uniref:Crh-like protein n=1 Tax=Komagataella pastoris TaxID=4922 RepID=A0A1B2J9L1_PICPA|nr:BA75_01243T0 [Komagataella pastoris]